MQRESTEWARFYWYNTEETELPRVLLIGDSIVAGYNEFVAKELKGKATVAFYSTSKCVGDPSIYNELKYALGEYEIDLVHFNNGLHGFTTSDEDYGKFLAKYTDKLQKMVWDTQLVWAMSTPITEVGNPAEKNSEKNSRVIERNRLAAEVMSKRGIPVNDLYSLMSDCQEEYSAGDGYHYNDAGREFQGKQVAEFILQVLGLGAEEEVDGGDEIDADLEADA